MAHNYGLSTKEALKRLHDDIESILNKYENKFKSENIYIKIQSAFVKRYDSPLGWFSILTTVLTIIGLFIIEDVLSGFVVLLILIIDLLLVIRDNNFRRTEIHRKVRNVLNEIKLAEEELCKDWEQCNYPHLYCPPSPCVTLQWTYRDGNIINLPWALLVRGDHIVMRPGQIAPGICTEINGKKKFRLNETYGISQATDFPSKPTARLPLPDIICVLENTPYLSNLEIMFENFLKRPPTIYNQQRYLLVTKYIQQWGFFGSIIVVSTVGAFRYTGIGFSNVENKNWKHIFIEPLVTSIIPVIPLAFPIMWIAINLWGISRLQVFLNTPQTAIVTEEEKSFQEDLDTPTYDYDNVKISRKDVIKNWLSLWKGSPELLGRSANVVQVLGSITALCCIDKKGVLSWPNPTAEKVFFLHDAENKTPSASQASSLNSEQTDIHSYHNARHQHPHCPPSHNVPSSHLNPNIATTTAANVSITNKTNLVAEVLDLTHDQHCPFKLEFDDHEWKNHISSLKPLGLAILLNTCNPLTHAHYAQFCGHVTAVAMSDKDLVPVTNRYAFLEMPGRCLCELAKQIGFKSHATDRFSLEGQLATYRHLQPEIVQRDIRFARQLQLKSKVKVPFPHSLSVVLREGPGGYLSLFTQGTADIILDFCDDFWDGKDLRPLGQQERKRAQDFYQRSALTAYCTAFAYRPLRHGICGALSGSQSSNFAYLELPPESKSKMAHADKAHCDFEAHTKLSHSISTDSLLFSEARDDDITDVESCFEMQCHQVFIGMVTMQYQAQTDIVQLIERLERACIRFVHFSKENELRSRVFSEKMGLESGWNCHISLLSEDQSNPQSPKTSGNFDHVQNISGGTATKIDENLINDKDIGVILQPSGLETSKTLSSSAPGAISNHEYNMLSSNSVHASNESLNNIETVIEENRKSDDSALDEHCQSLSILTDSTEQSAPVPFDMSNRAKLPRGIENIRPHLEKVDNVPLQVSLFTDCSAEATREMLSIMQSYGEIVVCIGSSASNANAEIFLQADCSIAIEPLYPQVCQDIPAYTESNILNNKLKAMRAKSSVGTPDNEKPLTNTGNHSSTMEDQSLENGLLGIAACALTTRNNTLSPIYLSRMLNSLPCSISVSRDDPLSIVAIIELSRRFSLGLWNCIQFWACCSCTLAIINILSACLSLPPIYTPITMIYIMGLVVPSISLTLTHIELDPKIMDRATGKKQTEYDTKVFGFVLWCYGCKFLPCIIVIILCYCAFMAHPIEIVDINEKRMEHNLELARIFSFLAIVLHFVIISSSFVHRDHSIWNKNPFSNKIWTIFIILLLLLHVIIITIQITLNNDVYYELITTVWPIIIIILLSSLISFIITEICKWEEIKINLRYQRRARLDFGTKLGMNSPF